jgi:hypothetical protein
MLEYVTLTTIRNSVTGRNRETAGGSFETYQDRGMLCYGLLVLPALKQHPLKASRITEEALHDVQYATEVRRKCQTGVGQ